MAMANNFMVLWNCCSAAPQLNEIRSFLFRKRPLFLCLVETRYCDDKKSGPKKKPPKFPSYDAHHLTHSSSASGVSVFFHNSIALERLPKYDLTIAIRTTKLMFMVCRFNLHSARTPSRSLASSKPSLLILSYCPPYPTDPVTQNTIKQHFSKILADHSDHNVIWVGDFNNDSLDLAGSTENPRYNGFVSELVLKHNLIVMNPDQQPTMLHSSKVNDLIITSNPNLFPEVWIPDSKDDFDLLNSDHFPVYASLDIAAPPPTCSRPPSFLYDRADWAAFAALLDEGKPFPSFGEAKWFDPPAAPSSTYQSSTHPQPAPQRSFMITDVREQPDLRKVLESISERKGPGLLDSKHSRPTPAPDAHTHAPFRDRPAPTPQAHVDGLWNHIRAVLLAAAEITIPVSEGRKNAKSWWTKAVDTAYHAYKQATRRMYRHPNKDKFKRQYDMARSHFRRTVREQTAEMWKKLCDKFAHPRTGALDWKRWQRTVGNNSAFSLSGIKPGGADAKTPPPSNLQDSLNNLSDFFHKIFASPEILSSPMDDWIRDEVANETKSILSNREARSAHLNSNISLSRWFSMTELEQAIGRISRSTSPGRDRIHNQLLIHTPPQFRRHLLDLYNHMLRYGVVPADWKLVLCFAFYKKAGDRTEPANYRTISLLATLLKLLEQLIANRIRPHVDPHLHDRQFGFRPKRSTHDCISLLRSRLNRALSEGNAVPVAFLDVKKAFDTVDTNHLLASLLRLKISGPIWLLIRALLSDRSFSIRSGDLSSDPRTAPHGVPQGSILAPLLFIIFFDSISAAVGAAGCALMYADDIAIIPKLDGLAGARQLQAALDAVSVWALRNKIIFNTTRGKSATVWFRPPDTPVPSVRKFRLSKADLDPLSSYPYLGMIFDEFMSFEPHHKHVSTKARASSFLITRTIAKHKHTTPHIYSTLTRTITDAIVMYSLAFWCPTTQQARSLDAIRVAALRRSLLLPPMTHYHSVFFEFRFLPTSYLHALAVLRCCIRLDALYHDDDGVADGDADVKQSALNLNPAAVEYHRMPEHDSGYRVPHGPPRSGDSLALLRRKFMRTHDIDPADTSSADAVTNALFRSFDRSFREERYGSSIRLCTPADGGRVPLVPARSPSTPHQYLRFLPIKSAAVVARFRFDYVSPWRQFKHRKLPSASCPSPSCCAAKIDGHDEARVEHFISHCPSNSEARRAFLSDLSSLSKSHQSLAKVLTADIFLSALLTPSPTQHLPVPVFRSLLPFALRFLRRSHHTLIRLLSIE